MTDCLVSGPSLRSNSSRSSNQPNRNCQRSETPLLFSTSDLDHGRAAAPPPPPSAEPSLASTTHHRPHYHTKHLQTSARIPIHTGGDSHPNPLQTTPVLSLQQIFHLQDILHLFPIPPPLLPSLPLLSPPFPPFFSFLSLHLPLLLPRLSALFPSHPLFFSPQFTTFFR